jgi:hypothetical protein
VSNLMSNASPDSNSGDKAHANCGSSTNLSTTEKAALAEPSSTTSSLSLDALSFRSGFDSGSASSVPLSNRYLIHAHSNILSVSSPYFRTLFSGAWRTMSDGRIIAKQDKRTIRRMLEFVYTGEMTAAQAMKLPFEDLVQLHDASAEYQIEALRAMTEVALAQNVSAANLVRMLQLASLHDGTSCTIGVLSSFPDAQAASSSSNLPTPPCILMKACVAVLKNDIALFASDGMIDCLAGHPQLRISLRAALEKKNMA